MVGFNPVLLASGLRTRLMCLMHGQLMGSRMIWVCGLGVVCLVQCEEMKWNGSGSLSLNCLSPVWIDLYGHLGRYG